MGKFSKPNYDNVSFEQKALALYHLHRKQNPIYREYLKLSGQLHNNPTTWKEIPGLPISFFRSQTVLLPGLDAEVVFTSSGTTGQQTSRHVITDLARYQQQCVSTFESFFGAISEFIVLALLPNYLERQHSGLVSMIDGFMAFAKTGSGYFLYNHDELREVVNKELAAGSHATPILLWGVSFALLDLIETEHLVLPPGSFVIETGGMKGRRKELTRTELHTALREKMSLPDRSSPETLPILSEYGMTEMNSQAYLLPNGKFFPAQDLRVATREINDPFSLGAPGKSGLLNIYDLANTDTCPFLLTEDIGISFDDNGFEVLGRLDYATIRGCNLLAEDLRNE